jgi:predicted alpha/beta superfamily hydrolase
LYALKNHIAKVHNQDPNEIISQMANEMLTKPTQGSSSDFSNWGALRILPKRSSREKKNQGGKGKKFRHWI